MTAETFPEIKRPDNPFPGLRPFDFDDSHLFFGRDGQSEELIAKLAKTRFVAVVGTSGSGKSSLVRAGLLPALLGGFMASASSNWRIAVMHPGNDPIGNLAEVLNSPGSKTEETATLHTALVQATLRRGSRGFIDAIGQAGLAKNENLLLVVDQFEEIFRFARVAGAQYQNEAAAFVKLFLEPSRLNEPRIYVVLTMRSDYLGDCSQFWDLPEAINESQYLVPRLTRDQLRAAITGPVAVGGGQITSRLVNRLLNDVGDNQDQLPVLQHLLMRAWDESKEKRLEIESTDGDRTIKRRHLDVHEGEAIDLCCYEAVGGMAQALSIHADEAFKELPDDRHRMVAEKLFKALTEKGPDNREIRRPAKVSEICSISETIEAEVCTVIESFRKPGRSFLTPPVEFLLSSNSSIDISHESLIRGWKGHGDQKRLLEWVDEEAESAHLYQRLGETAKLYREEKALLRDPDLQRALNWQKKNNPNKYWAQRYDPDFETVIAFLQDSKQQRDKEIADDERRQREEEERKQRELEQAKALAELEKQKADDRKERLEEKTKANARLRLWVVVSMVFGSLALASMVIAVIAYRRANTARADAIKEKVETQHLRLVANMNLAHEDLVTGNLGRVVQLLDISFPNPGLPGDPRSFLWYYVWRRAHREMATLRGHSSIVFSVAFSPDGQTLASASEDKTVKLWDVSTRRELSTLTGHLDFVRTVAFSPDGKMLASAGDDSTVKLWDVGTKSLIETLRKQSGAVLCVAFSPNGKTLATAGDAGVKLWDLSTRPVADPLAVQSGGYRAVAFSPDGKILASGGSDKKVKLWDTVTRKLMDTLPEQTGGILSVAFSRDGKQLAWSINDKTVKLWDIGLRKELAAFKAQSDVFQVAFSPDGKLLASTSLDGSIKLRDTATHEDVATLSGHSLGVFSVAFSPDGKMIASGSADTTVKLTDSWQEPPTVLQDSQSIFSLAFSPDGKTLAVANEKDTVKVWDIGTRKELIAPLTMGDSKSASSVAFSPDGKTLAAGVSDGTLMLWDTGTWKVTNPLPGNSAVTSMAFSPDGKDLAAGCSDGTVRLWDIGTRKELVPPLKHSDVVLTVAFSPDGKTLAAGGYGKTVSLWDVSTGKLLDTPKPLQHLRAVLAVAFSPDGKTLASSDFYGAVKLWDVGTRTELTTLMGNTNGVRSVAFSPDGKTLAAAGFDSAVKLWDTGTLQQLATLTGHLHAVYSVAFSPDGRTLASGSSDKTVRLWIGATNAEVERAGR